MVEEGGKFRERAVSQTAQSHGLCRGRRLPAAPGPQQENSQKPAELFETSRVLHLLVPFVISTPGRLWAIEGFPARGIALGLFFAHLGKRLDVSECSLFLGSRLDWLGPLPPVTPPCRAWHCERWPLRPFPRAAGAASRAGLRAPRPRGASSRRRSGWARPGRTRGLFCGA